MIYKNTLIQLFSVLFFISNCYSQKELKKLHNKDFNWTISIPENFKNVNPSEWSKLQNRGKQAFEDTYNQEIVNQAKTIFVFKSAGYNYLEANYQPFDEKIDGSYIETYKEVNEMLMYTFETQLPDAKIDSTSTIEKISGLEFRAFKLKIENSNGMTMSAVMYCRLFGKKEFSLNIFYIDEKLGEKMIQVWKNSTFE